MQMSTERMGNPRYILHGETRGLHAKLSTGTRTAEKDYQGHNERNL